MMQVDYYIHRLTQHQLKVLFFLAKSRTGVISSVECGKKIEYKGKALGGVFSSLVRRKINNESLIIPWGKSDDGRSLKWKLNSKLISKERLLKVTKEILFET